MLLGQNIFKTILGLNFGRVEAGKNQNLESKNESNTSKELTLITDVPRQLSMNKRYREVEIV